MLVKSLDDAVRQNSPTLVRLDKTYPSNPSIFWLKYQLIEVFSFCGVYKNLSEYQIRRTAELIRHEYYWITVTELMEFFTQFEAGKFNKMYGYNPQDLLKSLNQFARDIQSMRGEIEREKQQQKLIEETSRPGISYEEYCKRKGRKPIDRNNLIKKV